MKKVALTLMLTIFTTVINAQEIILSFQSEDPGKKIDSLWATNLNTNERVKLMVTDTLLLTEITGISDYINPSCFVYPNPCKGVTKLVLNKNSSDIVKINIYSITGQTISNYSDKNGNGESFFALKFPGTGIFIVSAQIRNEIICRKVICLETDQQESSIEYEGIKNNYTLKQGLAIKTIGYAPGNIIHYLVCSGNNKTVFTDSPHNSKNYKVEFYDCMTSDAKSYKTVKIGDQIWMAENLSYLPAVSDWKNGSNIDRYYYVQGYKGTDVAEAKETQGYRNHGVLYNLPAALKACPEGWHLPSDLEWDDLAQFVSDQKGPFEKTNMYWYEVGKYLKACYTWLTTAKGTDDFGFSVLPGGQRTSGGTDITGQFGNFWTSTAYYGTTSYYWFVGGSSWIKRTTGMNDQGFSVRCVKD